jgi:hypothetical protein
MNNHAELLNYNEDILAADLISILQSIADTEADVALLTRIKAAPAKLAALIIQRDKLIADERIASEAKAKIEADARFSRFSDIRVSDKTPDQDVLGSSYEITYTANVYDMYLNASVPTPHVVMGFNALPWDAMMYLLERHPDKLPAKIARLAATPHDALERYTLGLRRGHLQATNHDMRRG